LQFISCEQTALSTSKAQLPGGSYDRNGVEPGSRDSLFSAKNSILYNLYSLEFTPLFSTKCTQMQFLKHLLQVAWPNGKALLSGLFQEHGKDCGFESHRHRFCCFWDFGRLLSWVLGTLGEVWGVCRIL
jgi:hypothetical protein